MTRSELEHAIRAACDVSGDHEVYVFGSQAILGQYPEAPERLRQSAEADKDREFVRVLILERLIDPRKLLRRLGELPERPQVTPRLLDTIEAWIRGALKDIGPRT